MPLPNTYKLDQMDRTALLELWAHAFGETPPKRLSNSFLKRYLAFELQSEQFGGLSRQLLKNIERIESEKRQTTSPKLKPGGRLIRQWNGVTHIVDVTDDGYFWNGQRHRSLSAIARAITGAHWSGPRFFGIKTQNNK